MPVLAFEIGDATPLGGGVMRYVVDFGNANAGGAPAFTIYKRLDNLDDVAAPPVTEIAGGQYYWSVDWATMLATSITYKLELAGIELSGVISAPNIAVPGTTVAEAGISSLQGYEQVGAIIAKAGIETKVLSLLPAQVAAYDPFADANPDAALLIRLLDKLGRETSTQIKAHLQREFSLTTAAAATSYAVPADWAEPVDDTLWNRPGLLPAVGPVSAQSEAAMKAGGAGTSIGTVYRWQGNRITFPVAPADGLTLYGAYVSRYWVQTADSGSGPEADHVTAATDYVLHDAELMVLGLVYLFEARKGYDTTDALRAYRSRLEWAKGATVGARTLSLNGSGSGARFIDGYNLPTSGWGL